MGQEIRYIDTVAASVVDGADDDIWGFPFSACFILFWAVLACRSAWSTYH